MKRVLLFIIAISFNILPLWSQYITSKGSYLEGSNYISTSRIEAFSTKKGPARTASLSMDYLKLNGSVGHRLNNGEHFTIQMNFYERNIGQFLLLKCSNGNVIELNSNSIQRDPFVQIYWIDENTVKNIINGNIIKARIQTQDGFVDKQINNNALSLAVAKCYNLLKEEIKKTKLNEEKFKSYRNNF